MKTFKGVVAVLAFAALVSFAIWYEPDTTASAGEPSRDVLIVQNGQTIFHGVSAGKVSQYGSRVRFTDKTTGEPVRISRSDYDTVIITIAK